VRSDKGVTSLELRTNEIDDGQDVVASGASAAESHFAAHPIALFAAPFAQKPLVASRTFVNGLADETMLPAKCVGEMRERAAVRLAVAQSERPLAATGSAVQAASDPTKAPLAHRADRLGEAIVTRIVTHGDRGHAPTACASVGARASSRTN